MANSSSVSCPTSSDCWAVGLALDSSDDDAGVVLATTNMGFSWTVQIAPIGNQAANENFTGVSCPTATDCSTTEYSRNFDFAFDSGGVLATTNAGSTWVPQSLPADSATDNLSSVSCATTSDCWAVGDTSSDSGTVFATVNGGATWNPQTLPAALPIPASVSCPTSSECWVVGDTLSGSAAMAGTTDGGATWESVSIPSGITNLNDVSCLNGSNCWAVGFTLDTTADEDFGTVLATTDGGTTWVPETVPSQIEGLFGISCPTSSDCWAVGPMSGTGQPTVIDSTDGGATWATQELPSDMGFAFGVSCPTTSSCWVVGENSFATGPGVAVTTDSGTTWTDQTLPNELGYTKLENVTCTTSSNCLAVGDSTAEWRRQLHGENDQRGNHLEERGLTRGDGCTIRRFVPVAVGLLGRWC